MKKIIIGVIVLIIVGLGTYYIVFKNSPKVPIVVLQNDYKNISYEIEGQIVLLKNGIAESEVTPAPASASKIITKYFGNEVKGDFNQDGLEDVAFLLTQDRGGSGTFYYVVVAQAIKNGYQGTNAVFLGDRIAPQTTEFRNGEIIVNYAERKSDEPFTVQPSVGVSKYLKIVDARLVEN